MARDNVVESATISFNNSNPTEANFGTKCKRVVLKPSANCYIAFDRPANTGDFLLASNDSNVPLPIDVEFTRVSCLGTSGSGSLYILGIR